MWRHRKWSVWPRRRRVGVRQFDTGVGRWEPAPAARSVRRNDLCVSTFNVWFDPSFATDRYRAIADLLAEDPPDVMAFQEVTDSALTVLLAQPWIREHYLCASITGRRVGTYGALLLSRLPLAEVTYTRLPTRSRRGFLRAELLINDSPTVVCSVHLDSGKRLSRLRERQLRTIFAAVQHAENVVLLGDFNMRDDENHRIAAPFVDVWPALCRDDGFTADTSINHMRCDSKDKHQQYRFDRVLLKGAQWRAESIELLGRQPISPNRPRVFASDHFGLRCHLSTHPKS